VVSVEYSWANIGIDEKNIRCCLVFLSLRNRECGYCCCCKKFAEEEEEEEELVVITLWGSLAGWDNALQVIHTSISNSLHCIKQHRSSVLLHQAWTCSHHCPFFLFCIWWAEFNRPKSKFIRGTWWSIVYHNTLLGSAVKMINTNILETLERSHTYFQVVNNVIINNVVAVTCGWWFFIMCHRLLQQQGSMTHNKCSC
jgi:hypothetical protein